MYRENIAVMDSGVGGLSILKGLVKELPCNNYFYFGDNDNAPYGNKSHSELLQLVQKNLKIIEEIKPTVLVVACNTLSVSLFNEISYMSGIKTFGVRPPAEKYITGKGKTLLLSTVATAKYFKSEGNLYVKGLPHLVEDIEKNVANFDHIDLNHHFSHIYGYFDRIILGCTHYIFIENQILNHFRPREIISGNNKTIEDVKAYLGNKKSLEESKGFCVNFIGNNSQKNKQFFSKI